MARLKNHGYSAAAVREFTPAELERIAQLIVTRPKGHPSPVRLELEAIHRAAGRVRGLKLWALDPVPAPGSPEFHRAFREEISDRRYW
ncbi:hypothetical protein [Nocardia sp. NPDC047038]|uniref:hypothetical protein n=1 Tax=Nocardia sp. NPDC047038 TaxID=3154338 RepID=UPI0033CDA197